MVLEDRIVYGPLWSRRFGWDLGINLLPTDRKLCVLDCVYCQYGFTPRLHNRRTRFPNVREVIREWKRQLDHARKIGVPLKHTTVSGNGEPTMHPHFAEIAAGLAKWRNANAPEVRLAVLSNGYRIHDPTIRKALQMFDEPVIKLDSAITEKYEQLDQPQYAFNLPRFIKNLQRFKKLQLQTMFVKGWNDEAEDLREWRKALSEIKPQLVQIYTIARDTAVPGLCPLSSKALQRIAHETTQMINVPVKAYV
jgi:wyosine [tRNA(Phe)-imidazoG37] synthetase (radical SAM superfamily)